MAGPGTCGSGAAACIAVDQALAFVTGRLIPAERAAVEHRIASCAACRAVVAEATRSARAQPAVTAPLRAQPPAVTAPLRAQLRPPAEAPAEAIDARAATSAALLDDRGEVIGEARRAAPRLDSALAPGELVGRYVVERPLGAGGMGVVSLARDPELRRPIVIKLVHPEMIAGEGGDDLEARLRREAQAMAQVSHSNVVQIFDIGRRGDRVFLAMEFVAGQTLDEWLRERRRTPDEILGAIRQAGAGLAAAHRAGLVHRDFKPSNVLVGSDGVVKVTDFGLARSVAAGGGQGAGATRKLRVAEGDRGNPRGAPQLAPRPSGVHAVLTEVNAIVGTPAYMAPEQAAGAPLDARTDQYAMALTLLDALLAQPPSRRTVAPSDPTAMDAALQVAGVAPPVRAAILRALSADPAARFASIDDLVRALVPPVAAPAAPAAPPRSRRTTLAIAGIALCGVAVGVWFVVGRAGGAACTTEVPAKWNGAPRARLIAALSAAPRLFAGWEAQRVAGAIDSAVDALGDAETARCRREPPGRDGTAECIAQRSVALAALMAASAVPAAPPSTTAVPTAPAASPAAIAAPTSSLIDDPWLLVHRIERCDTAAPPATAELRGKLRGATAAQASELAAAAHKLGDELLAADAREVAGTAALAAGDAALAGEQFRAMSAAGLAADSAAAQGRALLHLIEVARATGEYALAEQNRVALDALLGRYRDAPRDVVAVALVEGDAFGDLGDVATAFAAWDRARTAATALGDHDALLAAAIGRARALHALRFDLAGARAAATAALAAGAAASPAARATALGSAADLAIAAGDGRAAAAALDEAGRLDPAQAGLGPGGLRNLRTRALLGDVDGALSELVGAASGDPLATARVRIARGQVLLAADHAREAGDVLDEVAGELRHGAPHATLPVAERIDLELAACEAHAAAGGDCRAFRVNLLVASLHPRAPARARLALLEASTTPPERASLRSHALRKALDILVDAGAAPVRIAELRWQIAQLCPIGTDCRAMAVAARDAFEAAGRTAEIAAIDRWLIDAPVTPSWVTRDAGVPDTAPPPHRERGPQP